jgi:dihydroorotase
MYNQRKNGDRKLVCQLTVRAGRVVYDLNGISSDVWDGPATSDYRIAGHWTTLNTRDDRKIEKEQPATPAPVH